MDSIQLLKFIRKSRGATVAEIMKMFSKQRTATIYQLDSLIRQDLIIRQLKGRAYIYHIADQAKVKQYFEKQIERLKVDEQIVLGSIERDEVVSKNRKLKLVFPNYFDFTR
jgi:predicted transcriptional regulator